MPTQKRSQAARVVGYAVVAACLCLAIWGAILVRREIAKPDRIVRVHFNELGSLAPQDPVVLSGVTIGKVRDIVLDSARQSVVEVQLFDHRFLPADSRFVDFSHSPMGSRRILLLPGRSAAAMDESLLQEGLFFEGLTEMLRRVQAMVDGVITLQRQIARTFADPDAPLSPIAAQRRLEEALRMLAALSEKIESTRGPLESGLADLNVTGENLRATVRAADPAADSAWARMRAATRMLDDAAESLEPFVKSAESISSAARDSTGLGRLLESGQVYADLETSLSLLLSAEALLSKDGLDDVVHPHNIHFHKRVKQK